MNDTARQIEEARRAAADPKVPPQPFSDYVAKRLFGVYIFPVVIMAGGSALFPVYWDWCCGLGMAWMFLAASTIRP